MRVFLPNRSQELLGDYCAVCCCKSSLCVHSLIKYNSKGCHRLKELQKCLVSSAMPEYPHGSSSETGGIHRGRAVSLHVSLPPDPRMFLGSPGAGTWSLHPSLTWSLHLSHMESPSHLLIQRWGPGWPQWQQDLESNKEGIEMKMMGFQMMKSQPSPISAQPSGSGHRFTSTSLSDNFSPSPPSQSFCENRNAKRQGQVPFLQFL